MRTRLLLLLTLFLFILMPAAAQEDASPVYRLHVPSVDEFIDTVQQIRASEDFNEYADLLTYLELNRRYPDFMNLPFDQLSAIAEFYRDRYSIPVTSLGESIRQDTWNEWLITAWLRENPSALDTADQIAFGHFNIEITRADLNGDGEDELILYILERVPNPYSDGEHDNYVDFWVLQRDPDSDISYRRIQTPLEWYEDRIYGGAGVNAGNYFTLAIEDVTGDGVNEWLVISAEFLMSGFGQCRHLHILSWQDDALVDLAEDMRANDRFGYCMDSQDTFSDLIDDPTPDAEYTILEDEIQLTFTAYDSWGCIWEETKIFRWNGELFTQGSVEQDLDPTFNCALRLAEFAMWGGNIEMAIEEYERAFTLPDRIPSDENTFLQALYRERRQYALARLAIAYALFGREDDARSVIADLQAQQPESLMISMLQDSLSQAENTLEICLSAYEVFDGLTRETWYRDPPTDVTVGFIEEYFGLPRVRQPIPSPERAGCDVAWALSRLIEDSESPLNLLSDSPTDLSMEIRLEGDINGDDRVDWLIAVRDFASLLLVESLPEGYQVRQTRMSSEGDYAHIALPDDLQAVVQVEPMANTWSFCPDDRGVYIRIFLSIFEYSDFAREMCETDFSIAGMDGLFPNGDGAELHIIVRLSEDETETRIYQWNTEDLTYYRVRDPDDEVFIWRPDPDFLCGSPGDNLCAFFVNVEDESEALFMIDNLPTEGNQRFDDPDFWCAVQYRRALALEFLDRPDEALAEYVAIYESAPESAWGMLARLHLEIVGS